MDERSWTSPTFTLSLKRARPTTPLQTEESHASWDDFDGAFDSETFHSYSDANLNEASEQAGGTQEPSVSEATDNASSGVRMRTGCISCLMKGQPCDPKDPGCQKALSTDWSVNQDDTRRPSSTSLTIFRPDTKWHRGWRERHSLNFFVNFSAPQMAGFFDSDFWNRLVIQTSYYEPAILHAITAIGALHESILQRAYADEKRRAQAMEFALSQCNKSIAELTNSQTQSLGIDSSGWTQNTPNSRLALTTCILFTSFEALQGRCDSAVNHALQGRRLLQATDKSRASNVSRAEEDDLENMRPIVERLEVQATALLDKGRRPEIETLGRSPLLPSIDYPYNLDHAHSMLHGALNSVMRFMQGFQPTASRDQIACTMQEKYMHYAPWFARWEEVFTAYLAANREIMSSIDLKRAMVLKANHLVGTMLASVDQAAGPVAYDAYETEFRAIVDLSREVLATFSCPPLPTLTAGSSGTPYLSFSLWVTDPLWMAISRCRHPSIRQAAFSLLSQNPRQEGIWHAGPMLSSSSKIPKRSDSASEAVKKRTAREAVPNKRRKSAAADRSANSSRTLSAGPTGSPDTTAGPRSGRPLDECETRVKDEWPDMLGQVERYAGSNAAHKLPGGRYKSHCQGRCSIPYLEDLRFEES